MENLLSRQNQRTVITTVLAILLFAAISWVYFYPDDVMGNVLRQHDVTQGVANGHEVNTYEAATGEVSRWTNSLFSGMPTFQITPTYESSSLLSWVNSVMGLGFPTPVNLVFIMLVGFFILMLSFKVKWYVAVMGAIAYAFSSYFFILIGAGHIWKYVTLAYIPPTIAGIVWAYRGHIFSGSAVAALFAAVQLSWNHVQMTYYFMFLIVLVVIAFFVIAKRENAVNRWLKATGALAVAAVLAVAANAPNLYSTLKYSKETMRGGHSEIAAPSNNNTKGGLDKDYITAWSYGKAETFTLLIPNVCGGATIKPEKGSNRFLSLADTDQAKEMLNNGTINMQEYQFMSQLPQYFGNQPMTNGPVYVGALIFALFVLGCITVKGPMKWALLAATIISILLSWGRNMMWLTDLMIDYFPMYNKFRTVASILVIAEFTMPLLAMLALNQMFTQPDWWKKHSKAFIGTMLVCGVVCLFVYFVPSTYSLYSVNEREQLTSAGLFQQYPVLFMNIEAIRKSMISADALRSLLFLVAGAGVLYVYLIGKLRVAYAAAAAAVILFADLFTINKRYLDTESFTESVNNVTNFNPRIADRKILADTAQNYRVYDIQHFGEAMPSYFHKCIGGYHAAKLTRYQDLIDRQISQGNIEVINMLNAKYVIQNDSTVAFNPGALGNAWFVDTLTYVNGAAAEMNALDHLHTATQAVADQRFASVLGKASPVEVGDTIFETIYAPNALTYSATSKHGGVAVFSEVYFPWGWKAEIDGKEAEIGRVNYVLRALNIPAGHHTITFRFDPPSVRTADTVATIAIVLIYLSLLVALNVSVYRSMRRKADKDNENA
ncbi:MAG: hypothetical protein ACI4AH_04155 [Muribaculaceae bacterium]